MSSQKLLDAFGPEERTPKYGSSNASISSLSSQSSEEAISLKVATRKKKRLERHHKSRPKLKSTLSKIVHSTQVSEEEDNVIEIPNNNMVISELDQK
jgi:hypothetical protein